MKPALASQLLRGDEPLAPAANAPSNGLVAVGGELTVERLLEAYQKGIFPWSSAPVSWWSPDPRGILPLEQLHISRRLQQKLRQNRFRITFDTAFSRVIRHCAATTPERQQTWICPAIIAAYEAFHQAGYAHSVEAWLDDNLVGGLYGVAVAGMFAGESMFHLETDASKVVLVHTVRHLRERGFVLFDTQETTPITRTMGAIDIPRTEYLKRLETALAIPATFTS